MEALSNLLLQTFQVSEYDWFVDGALIELFEVCLYISPSILESETRLRSGKPSVVVDVTLVLMMVLERFNIPVLMN